jgi:hypothetical protein
MTRVSQFQFNTLRARFEGELYFDNSTLHAAQTSHIYATDASVYQEMPLP